MTESSAARVNRVLAAVTAVDGVVGLHSGPGVPSTHLPGRTVAGLRLGPQGGRVHVIVRLGDSLLVTAERVRAVATEAAGIPVDVVVGDVTVPHPENQERQS
ncbi:response regulator receiver protein [Mycolicibacterium canariasense]|uniref:Response regulator receiver protein n=1 Tax=Mycolicibacterium canariasense TaxID=228230 RepID=A0A100WH20_MYCCR|nr:hypothetical protein [Mycolicibacterium canariasense]MCV7212996.1 hypothetical protein [Mycolicibacterium canariasense]ORV10208.1 histidine kinase [Mycolicibacterium canariasense]GAS98136.1 response regulator receiver protein [Mycolicibacterium canariasense]